MSDRTGRPQPVRAGCRRPFAPDPVRPARTVGLTADLLEAAARALLQAEDRLGVLDTVIGDGDHGRNMARGARAVAGIARDVVERPLAEALHCLGMTVVNSVGGAAGPLYGSCLLAMAQAAETEVPGRPIDPPMLARLWAAGVEAVKRRGRSDVGAKTMLDVLVPALAALSASPRLTAEAVRAAAEAGLAGTGPMRATKGRAAYLGDRSVGHLDPGAASAALIIERVIDAVEAGG